MEQKKCYLSTPFLDPFRAIREIIAKTVKEVNVVPISPDLMPAGRRSFADSVQEIIQEADFVIADLTEGNPNVIYEVGLSHALRKPVLLLTQNIESVPAALQQYLIAQYDPQKLRELRDVILLWFSRTTARGVKL